MKSNFKILFKKAEHDKQTVEKLLLFPDSPTDTAAFHIQQMIEKLLKCLLISANIEYKPSHDLFYILNKIEPVYSDLTEYYDLAEKLTPHAVLNRYEEGYELSMEDVKNLFNESLKLRETIIKYIEASYGELTLISD